MEAAFRQKVWQGVLALATAGFCPVADAGIISGLSLPTSRLSRINRVDDFESVTPPSSVPAGLLTAAADVAATAWSAGGLSAAADEFEVSATAAPRQTRLLDLVTGLTETGSHVVFPGGPELGTLAGFDRDSGRRANAGAGGGGNAFSAGATGGGNSQATSQRSTSQANFYDDSDTSLGNSVPHDPSRVDSGSLVTGALTGEPAATPGLPFLPPPAFEIPAPLQTIEPAPSQIVSPDAPFAASAVVASVPTGFVIMGAGLSGFIGVSLTAYGIKSQGTRRRGRRNRGDVHTECLDDLAI